MPGFEFYTVCHSRNDNINKGIERLGNSDYYGDFRKKVNVLTSFSSIFKQGLKEISLPSNSDKIMIDSGAYDFQIKDNGTFPYDVETYFHKILEFEKTSNIRINYLVSMDYICSKPKNSYDKKKNLKRIKDTVKKAKELIDLHGQYKPKPNFKIIPVVQGYLPNEYKKCLELMIKAKIIKSNSYIGIGSVANRKKVKEIEEILRVIKETLIEHSLDSIKIHIFGLNLNAIKNPYIARNIASFDSFSWTFPYRYGRVKVFTGKRMIEANTRKKLKELEFYEVSLRTTLDYINHLNFRLIHPNSNFKRKKDLEQKIKNFEINFSKIKIQDENNLINNISNEILIFTGNQLVFLDPKKVTLSSQEKYHVFSNSIFHFFSTILSVRKKIGQKINEFRSLKLREKLFNEKLILENIIIPFESILNIIEENPEQRNKINENRQIKELYCQILPYLSYSIREYPGNNHEINEYFKKENQEKRYILSCKSKIAIDNQILAHIKKIF